MEPRQCRHHFQDGTHQDRTVVDPDMWEAHRKLALPVLNLDHDHSAIFNIDREVRNI